VFFLNLIDIGQVMPEDSPATKQRLIEQSLQTMQLQVGETYERVGKIFDQLALLMGDRLTLDHTIKALQEYRINTDIRLKTIEEYKRLSLAESAISEAKGGMKVAAWLFGVFQIIVATSVGLLISIVLSTHDIAITNQNSVTALTHQMQDLKNDAHTTIEK
jgi:hypothetical protein